MTRHLTIAAGLIAVALLIGIVAGRFSADTNAAPPALAQPNAPTTAGSVAGNLGPAEPSTDLTARVAALEEALRSEVQARTRLEHALQGLRPTQTSQPGSKPESVAEATPREDVPNTTETPTLERPQALAQFGLDTFRVSQLNKQVEELEMQHLVLRDKASREGWVNTPRYADAVRKLPDEADVYRKELGDNNYDAFLYRTGQANRVSVQSVLAGSPAQKAGIEAGDLIYSYADERVFAWGDLTGATSSGEPGQSVRIEVVRNGKKVNIYVPRGPLGVRMSADRSEP